MLDNLMLFRSKVLRNRKIVRNKEKIIELLCNISNLSRGNECRTAFCFSDTKQCIKRKENIFRNKEMSKWGQSMDKNQKENINFKSSLALDSKKIGRTGHGITYIAS